MRQSAVKVCSASQVVQGNMKFMHNKHVKFGNKLAEVWFSTNSFKVTFDVGLFKTFLIIGCQQLLDVAVQLFLAYIVAIGKPEWQVCKASHCGSNQQ